MLKRRGARAGFPVCRAQTLWETSHGCTAARTSPDCERINVNEDDALRDRAEKTREFLKNRWRQTRLHRAFEQHHLYFVSRGDVALGVMQHDEAIGLDHRAEHAGALVARGAHHQATVS